MKRIHIKTFIGTALMVLFLVACSDILDEQPRSIYEPGYFKTEKGVMGGLTSMYAHLRYIYGQAYYYNACLTGTDEATYAQSADGNFKDMDLSGAGTLTPLTSRSDVLWRTAFPNINTASGIIENAAAVGISDALIAEARFFRAFDYFLLVQTFGGVPLDLGAGELKFNTAPSRISVRNTVPEVYTKAIFPGPADSNRQFAGNRTCNRRCNQNCCTSLFGKSLPDLRMVARKPKQHSYLSGELTVPTLTDIMPSGIFSRHTTWQQPPLIIRDLLAYRQHSMMLTWAPNDRNKEILLYADHTQASEYL